MSQPAPHMRDRRGLWTSFARSVVFNVQAELVANCIRVGGVVMLARALAPRDFGILRVLLVIAAIAGLAGTAGFPEAVIQRKQLLREHQTTACWLTTACAAAWAGALFAAAPWIERWMAMPSLGGMIRLICVPVFIEGSACVPNALLQRALRYGALAAADVVAESGFVLGALALLYAGHPRLSLPGALAARSALRGAITWISAAFVPRGLPTISAARDLWPFASGVLGGQTMVILSQNADYIMVGRMLGGAALGYYSMAWDLLRFVPERLYRVVGRVTVPAFSAIQDDRAQLAHHYRALTAMVARLLLPAIALLAVAAPNVIGALYGAKWMAAALPLRLLSLGLAMAGLRLAIGSIYYARGLPALDIVVNGLRLAAIVVAIAFCAGYGLAAVCAAMSAVESATTVLGQWLVCRLTGLDLAGLAASIAPAISNAALCSLAALAGVALAASLASASWIGLLLIAAPAAAVFCWRERAAARALLRGSDFIASAAQAFGG